MVEEWTTCMEETPGDKHVPLLISGGICVLLLPVYIHPDLMI
jgi:hypothetical protein